MYGSGSSRFTLHFNNFNWHSKKIFFALTCPNIGIISHRRTRRNRINPRNFGKSIRYISGGFDAFQPHEILELLLTFAIPRKDTNPTAHRLLDRFGSLHGVFQADREELMKVEGVGSSASLLISLFIPLENAYRQSLAGRKITISDRETLKAYCVSLYSEPKNESFYVLSFDSRLQLLHASEVAKGTPDQVSVFPRTVLSTLLRHGATGCVLSHNHPAGTAEPSAEDLELTRTLSRLLESVGITLYDHIIVAEHKGISLKEKAFI